MTWLLQLFRRRPDVGLQLEAHRFGRTVTQPGRYDYAKAVAGKRKAEQRQAAVQRAEVARTRTKTHDSRKLRAIK